VRATCREDEKDCVGIENLSCKREILGGGGGGGNRPFASTQHGSEQALGSLKLKKSVDAEGGRTFAVIIEGG